MNPFFLIVLSVLGGGLLFLTHRLGFAPQWGLRWTRWAVPVVLVVMTGLSFLQFGAGPTFLSPSTARPVVWLGATWLAFALYLLLGLVLVAVLSFVWGRLGPGRDAGQSRRARRAALRERRQRINRWGVTVVTAAALLMTAFGVMRAGDPVVTPMDFTAPDLPAGFDGTTVALITDLHAGPIRSADFTRLVVDRINAAEPDMVMISGDVIDGPVDRFGPEIWPLADLKAPLGVYAVTGNHEMYSGTIAGWERAWTDLGITLVSNKVVEVRQGEDRIAVGGVHDWSGEGEFAPDYDAAVAEVGADDFAVVLAHQPRAALRLEASLVDLQLSGHTHGGQVWPFGLLVPLQQPAVEGLTDVEGIPVITSRGAGTWGPPVRVGADPQIPLITLKRG